jgi:hypothetical protein
MGLSTEEPLAAGGGWQLPHSSRDGIGLRSQGPTRLTVKRSRWQRSPCKSNTYNTRRVQTPKTFIESSAGSCHSRRKQCGTSRLFQSGTSALRLSRAGAFSEVGPCGCAQAGSSAFRDRTLGPTRLRGFCAGSSSSCLLSDSRLCNKLPVNKSQAEITSPVRQRP